MMDRPGSIHEHISGMRRRNPDFDPFLVSKVNNDGTIYVRKNEWPEDCFITVPLTRGAPTVAEGDSIFVAYEEGDRQRPFYCGMGKKGAGVLKKTKPALPYVFGLWTQGQANIGLTCIGGAKLPPWTSNWTWVEATWPHTGPERGAIAGMPPFGVVAFEREGDAAAVIVTAYPYDAGLGFGRLAFRAWLQGPQTLLWDFDRTHPATNWLSHPPSTDETFIYWSTRRWNGLFYDANFRRICVVGNGTEAMLQRAWILDEAGSLKTYIETEYRLEQVAYALNCLIKCWHSTRAGENNAMRRQQEDPFIRGWYIPTDGTVVGWSYDVRLTLSGHQVATSSAETATGAAAQYPAGSPYYMAGGHWTQDTPGGPFALADGRCPIVGLSAEEGLVCVGVSGSVPVPPSWEAGVVAQKYNLPGYECSPQYGIPPMGTPDDSFSTQHSIAFVGLNTKNGRREWVWSESYSPVHVLDSVSIALAEAFPAGYYGADYVGFAAQHSLNIGSSGAHYYEDGHYWNPLTPFSPPSYLDTREFGGHTAGLRHVPEGYWYESGGPSVGPWEAAAEIDNGAIAYPLYDFYLPGHPRIFPLPISWTQGKNVLDQMPGDLDINTSAGRIEWPKRDNEAFGSDSNFLREMVRMDPVGGVTVIDSAGILWSAFIHQADVIVMGPNSSVLGWANVASYIVSNYSSIFPMPGFTPDYLVYWYNVRKYSLVGRVQHCTRSKLLRLDAKTGKPIGGTATFDISQLFDYYVDAGQVGNSAYKSAIKRASIDQIYQIIPLPEIKRLVLVRDIRASLYDPCFRAVEVRDYDNPETVLSLHTFTDMDPGTGYWLDSTDPMAPVYRRIINQYSGRFLGGRGAHDLSGNPWIVFQQWCRNDEIGQTKILRNTLYFQNTAIVDGRTTWTDPTWTREIVDYTGSGGDPGLESEFETLAFSGHQAVFSQSNVVSAHGYEGYVFPVRST